MGWRCGGHSFAVFAAAKQSDRVDSFAFSDCFPPAGQTQPVIPIESRESYAKGSADDFTVSCTERKEQRNNKIVHDTHLKTKGTPIKNDKRIGRNDPCPCGSGKKYKNCCGK